MAAGDITRRLLKVAPVIAAAAIAALVTAPDDASLAKARSASRRPAEAQDICKLTLHEMGHLGGHEHAADPDDVMYSPFQSQPIPGPCVSPLPD